jgi:hypothetical protein
MSLLRVLTILIAYQQNNIIFYSYIMNPIERFFAGIRMIRMTKLAYGLVDVSSETERTVSNSIPSFSRRTFAQYPQNYRAHHSGSLNRTLIKTKY